MTSARWARPRKSEGDDLAEAAALAALVAGTDACALSRVARVRPDVLVDLARRNKVLWALLPVREELRRRAPEAAGRLDAYRLRTLALNRGCLSACARVSAALQRAGIDHVVIKGPLQQRILHGSPTVKASGDVDVLVAETDRERAAGVLGDLGYRGREARLSAWWVRHLGEEHFAHDGGEPTVDLHHGLRQPGSPPVDAHRAFIEAARAVAVDGVMVPTPSAPHLCLIVALSLVKALVAREPCLDHAADLRRALAALDADETSALDAQARAHGLAETLAAARAAATRVVAREPVPESADPLAFVDDETLGAMVVAPWSAGVAAPRRRALLWSLCGRAPVRFVREAGRVLASDLSRRRLEAKT